MVTCRNCGKEVSWVDDEGICQDCLNDDEDDEEKEWTEEEMDDFATAVINSPLDPRLK